jgi:hypothetical protein
MDLLHWLRTLYWICARVNLLGICLLVVNCLGFAMAEICSTSTLTRQSSLDLAHKPSSGSSEEASASATTIASRSSSSSASGAAVLRVLNKPLKVCPDFKDDAEQSACCPSKITQGAFYCCTEEQRSQLDWEADKEAWRLFFQSHILELVLGLIGFTLLSCVIMSYFCKRLTFCPMYQPKLFEPINSSNRYVPSSSTVYHQPHSSCPPTSTSRYRRQPLPTASNATANSAMAALNADLLNSSSSSGNLNQHHRAADGVGRSSTLTGTFTSSSLHNKPPMPYEAPPTYEFATSQPQQQQQSAMSNANVENGLANSRITTTTANPAANTRPPTQQPDWDCLVQNELNHIRQASSSTSNQ